MARSKVDEILDWKARRGDSVAATLEYECRELRADWEGIYDHAGAFSDLIPIRLVTIVEVFFRDTIREILDQGDPFIGRAHPLAKDLRFDFLLATTVQGRRLTVGDIIAHALPASRVEQILSSLEVLIPGFRDELGRVVDRWQVEVHGEANVPIIPDVDTTICSLGRMFETRHILVHERPSVRPYDDVEISAYFEATLEFLKAVEWVIVNTLHGDIPLTHLAMNEDAGSRLREAELKLDELLAQPILKKLETGTLEAAQSAWKAYADTDADMNASIYRGGSIEPMVWATAKRALTETRLSEIATLVDELRRLFGEETDPQIGT